MKLHKFVYTAIYGSVLAGASAPTLSTFAASNANQVSVITEESDLSNDNFDFTQFNRSFDFASNAALPEIEGVDYSKFTDVEIDWDNFSYVDLTPVQLELFQLVTQREYLRQTISGEINPDAKSLSDFTGEMALFFEGNMYLHGLISDSVAGSAINIVIDAVLAAAGYGSLKAIVTGMGEAKAKAWFKKRVLSKVTSKIAAFGAAVGASIVAGALNHVIDAIIDPGKYIAKLVDSLDHYPNNGYWEFTG